MEGRGRGRRGEPVLEVSGLGEEEEGRKRWRRHGCSLRSCSCEHERGGRRSVRVWALVEEIGPKEKGKERKKIQKQGGLYCAAVSCLSEILREKYTGSS